MTIDYINNSTTTRKKDYDLGIRKYLISVYQYITYALFLTATVSIIVCNSSEFMKVIHNSPMSIVITFAPLVMVLYISKNLTSLSEYEATTCLAIFSTLMGLSLSSIFLIFTGQSIAKIFFITAATFGTMSIYGNITKRDLSSIESFLVMGSIGLLASTIINILFHSSIIHFIGSIIGVIISTLFTAYDSQKVKELYHLSETKNNKLSIYGSLTLYMDFINLFVFLLQILGTRRND